MRLCWIVLSLFLSPIFGTSYVDFTDMSSYHSTPPDNQYVDFTDMSNHQEGEEGSYALTKVETSVAVKSSSDSTEEKGMVYLKRLVASILRQMNVRSHVFGPGEAITLDLQAELFHEDMDILTQFLSSNQADEYLHNVDRIFSNIIKVVPPPLSSAFEFDPSHFHLFYSLKFWLLLSTLSVVVFLILTLAVRTIFARSPMQMFFYAFLITFVVSCVWQFANLYEDAKSSHFSKIVQTPSIPKDCDFDNFGMMSSFFYFLRVHVAGFEDRCEQYYKTTMKDPLWTVSPVDAISKTFAHLVFSPLDYVGGKLGLFFGGMLKGVPFWLQPILIFSLFTFFFFGLFGYQVRTPFMSIMPAARREYDEPGRLEGRKEQSLVRVLTRDVGTDTSDLLTASSSCAQASCPPHEIRGGRSNKVLEIIHKLFSYALSLGDFLLRQCPGGDIREFRSAGEDSRRDMGEEDRNMDVVRVRGVDDLENDNNVINNEEIGGDGGGDGDGAGEEDEGVFEDAEMAFDYLRRWGGRDESGAEYSEEGC